MTTRFGPVELYLVTLPGDAIPSPVVSAITDLIAAGVIRLLDLVVLTKDDAGAVSLVDVRDRSDEWGFGSVELAATGITGDEDLASYAELLPPATSAAVFAIEATWARDLTARFADSGGQLLSYERVPAPVVNALADLLAPA